MSYRILFLNRSFYPDGGATGQLLTELCEDLASGKEFEVTAIVGPYAEKNKNHGFFFQKENYHGIEIFRTSFSTYSKDLWAGRFYNYLSYFLCAFFAALRVPRPQIIVSYTDPPITGLLARFFSKMYNAKFVFVCQDVFPQVANLLEGFHSPLLNRFLEWTNRYLLKKADAVIAIGETMKEKLISEKGADPARIHVIHNWADTNQIFPMPKSNEFSKEFGLDEKFVVMHSGNIGLSQDLNSLIEAAEILKEYEQIRFVIVGEGVKKNALMEIVASRNLKNVLFLPYQPKERLASSFSSADVFIVTLKPGLAGYIVPSKLYGILAAGRPYIAAVEEPSEVASITRLYGCGLMAPHGNTQALVDKIITLYKDPHLAQQMGVRGREASTSFDRTVSLEAYREVFCGLLKIEHAN